MAQAEAAPSLSESQLRDALCSASMKGRPDGRDVRSTVLDGKKISKLFSKEQRKFFATHAPAGVELDDLAVLGPIFVRKLRFAPAGAKSRLVAELGGEQQTKTKTALEFFSSEQRTPA